MEHSVTKIKIAVTCSYPGDGIQWSLVELDDAGLSSTDLNDALQNSAKLSKAHQTFTGLDGPLKCSMEISGGPRTAELD